MSSVVRVAEIEGRGRGLVATQPLRGGQIVLRDSPILLYSALPITKQQQPVNSFSYCDACFKLMTTPSPLAALHSSCCSHHIFCSPKCQTESVSVSPWICQALGRLGEFPWAQIDQPLERQVQARFLIAAYNLALVSPSMFQTLLSLEGRDSDSDVAIAQLLHSLISPLCPPIHGLSLQLTVALLAKDKLNAFGLMEPFSFAQEQHGLRSVRAYGIYPNASFFNHDCLPNACRFDYVDSASENNTDIVVRMIHDVPDGREICLSYFPVNENYSSRQKRLVEDYGFTCDCDRCKVEAKWSDNEDENEQEDEAFMEEDYDDEGMAAVSSEDSQNDFPHAYFFLRYMCNRENCWGTLAPLPPLDATPPSPTVVMECNVCGNLKNDEDIDSLSTGD